MRVAAAVLTYRPVHYDRLDLLDATVQALKAEAEAVYLIDNSPDDEALPTLRERYGEVTTNRGVLHTSGMGTNLCAKVLEAFEPLAHICVHSDDDMTWRPGWRDRLEAWWAAAPEEVALTGCHLEPEFYWNEIQAVVEYGGVRALARMSTGAASWSYRQQHREDIFPIPAQVQGVGDVPACQHLSAKGLGICQIDIAEHAAPDDSTWGNRTLSKYGWDVAPVQALLKGGVTA
jgi:hypothetical protein